MSANHILTEAEFDGLVIAGLIRTLGMDPATARATAKSRWPMCGEVVVAECRGRGLVLTADDVTDYLRHRFDRTHCLDGAPLTAENVVMPSYMVSELLDWAIAEGRGIPSAEAPPPPQRPTVTVTMMLDGLRLDDADTRGAAGFLLARSLRAGLELAGETREDIEYVIGPQLLALIERAVAGDSGAVDELERRITTDPAAVSNAAADRPVNVETKR